MLSNSTIVLFDYSKLLVGIRRLMVLTYRLCHSANRKYGTRIAQVRRIAFFNSLSLNLFPSDQCETYAATLLLPKLSHFLDQFIAFYEYIQEELLRIVEIGLILVYLNSNFRD